MISKVHIPCFSIKNKAKTASLSFVSRDTFACPVR